MESIDKSEGATPVEGVLIPSDPNARMDRKTLALTLKKAGFPITSATLATMAVRGHGPEFSRWGRRPLYRWGDALAWAEARLTRHMRSTSEASAAQ